MLIRASKKTIQYHLSLPIPRSGAIGYIIEITPQSDKELDYITINCKATPSIEGTNYADILYITSRDIGLRFGNNKFHYDEAQKILNQLALDYGDCTLKEYILWKADYEQN